MEEEEDYENFEKIQTWPKLIDIQTLEKQN